jgi:hypothetical protein
MADLGFTESSVRLKLALERGGRTIMETMVLLNELREARRQLTLVLAMRGNASAAVKPDHED